jgi:hypothetical protein
MSGDWPAGSEAGSQKPRPYPAPDPDSFPGGQPPAPPESEAGSQKPRPYPAPDPDSFPGGQPPAPPEGEWDDPEEESSAAADELDAAAMAGLSEVAAFLASVPAPVLPDAVEARISAALAAEVVARASRSAQAGDGARGMTPAPDAVVAGAGPAAAPAGRSWWPGR